MKAVVGRAKERGGLASLRRRRRHLLLHTVITLLTGDHGASWPYLGDLLLLTLKGVPARRVAPCTSREEGQCKVSRAPGQILGGLALFMRVDLAGRQGQVIYP